MLEVIFSFVTQRAPEFNSANQGVAATQVV